MRKYVGWVCAALLLGWLGSTDREVGIVPSLPVAQAGEGKLKFEIYQDKSKEHRWRLKAANGKVLATAGQSYVAKADVKKSVDRLVKDVGKYKFEVYQDKGEQFRWRALATNGQVVAVSSQGYVEKRDCEAAIELIKKGAAGAEVVQEKAEKTEKNP